MTDIRGEQSLEFAGGPLDNPAAKQPDGQPMVYREPWRSRFWRWMGFNGSYNPELLDFRYAEMEGYAEASSMVEVHVYVTFLDRLRILLTGNIRIETAIRTDVPIRSIKAMSQLTIMSPGFVNYARKS